MKSYTKKKNKYTFTSKRSKRLNLHSKKKEYTHNTYNHLTQILSTIFRLPTTQNAPLGIAFSGGGFNAFIQGMAMTRAMHECSSWNKIKYVASTSGGSWFTSMLFYSPAFYNEIIEQTEKPLPQIIRQKFRTFKTTVYSYIAHKCHHYQKEKYSSLLTSQFLTDISPLLSSFHTKGAQKLNSVLLNVAHMMMHSIHHLNWELLINCILNLFTNDIVLESADYRTQRVPQLENVALIQCLSLPPTAWQQQKTKTSNNRVDNTAYALEAVGLNEDEGYNMMLPLAWVDSGSSPMAYTGWNLHKEIRSFRLHPLPKRDCFVPLSTFRKGKNWNKSVRTFTLPQNPSILTATSGSSAAAGFLCSPSIIRNIITHEGDNAGWMGKEITKTILDYVEKHTSHSIDGLSVYPPFGLSNLAVSTNAHSPNYRFLDGGFTDDLGISHQISRMQQDILLRNSSQRHLQIIATNAEALWAYEAYFAGDFNKGCLPGELHRGTQIHGLYNTPSIQLFREEFPKPTACSNSPWRAYLDAQQSAEGKSFYTRSKLYNTYVTQNTTTNRKVSAELPIGVSTYFTGTLTTVENKAVNVLGGWTVDVLFFQTNIWLPMLIFPENKANKHQNPFYTLSDHHFDNTVDNYALVAQKLNIAHTYVLNHYFKYGPRFVIDSILKWDDIK